MMLVLILNGLIDVLAIVADWALIFLPNSPFSIDLNIPAWADIIFYFIPFKAMITFLGTYLVSVGVYYCIRVALRWLKVVGS